MTDLRADLRDLAAAVPSLPDEQLAARLAAVARRLRASTTASRPEQAAIRDLLGEIEQCLLARGRDAIAGNLRELAAIVRLYEARAHTG